MKTKNKRVFTAGVRYQKYLELSGLEPKEFMPLLEKQVKEWDTLKWFKAGFETALQESILKRAIKRKQQLKQQRTKKSKNIDHERD